MLESSTKFIIFLHIQKTGGITLQRILRRKLGPSLPLRAIRSIRSKKSPNSLEEAMKAKRYEDRFFVAHCCFGAHRYLPEPYTYMTMLREPVQRIISLYYFSKENPTAYYHQRAVDKSIEEFALETQLMELDNGQVRFLAGDDQDLFINRTPIGACSNNLLEQAKSNLDQYFSFVGLTEKFDQSMLMLAKAMGQKQCLYLRRNVANKVDRPAISHEIRQLIAERNTLDSELYKYAQKRLEQDLTVHQLNDQDILESFKSKNKRYNTLLAAPYDTYDALKARLKGQLGRP
ncbi:MAG: sulfotransferase family 2 domain-containing protein [Cyanobacteria bacterium J06634_6]